MRSPAIVARSKLDVTMLSFPRRRPDVDGRRVGASPTSAAPSCCAMRRRHLVALAWTRILFTERPLTDDEHFG